MIKSHVNISFQQHIFLFGNVQLIKVYILQLFQVVLDSLLSFFVKFFLIQQSMALVFNKVQFIIKDPLGKIFPNISQILDNFIVWFDLLSFKEKQSAFVPQYCRLVILLQEPMNFIKSFCLTILYHIISLKCKYSPELILHSKMKVRSKFLLDFEFKPLSASQFYK